MDTPMTFSLHYDGPGSGSNSFILAIALGFGNGMALLSADDLSIIAS